MKMNTFPRRFRQMAGNGYREVKAGTKPFKKAYISVMMWFLGRSIQATSRVDKEVRKEFEEMPAGYTFSMGVVPNGPSLIVGKDKKGRVRYLGGNPEGKKIDLRMTIKNLEAALLLFTFQESTVTSICRDRIDFAGDLPPALAVIRVLNMVEVYILPKMIAKLAVKRYPAWTVRRLLFGRVRIYFRAILGY